MELLSNLTLYHPSSVEDAVSLYSAASNGHYLAGGSDFLVNVRRGIEQPDSLIYLNNIAEMQAIKDAGDTITIGGGVILRDLDNSALIQKHFAAVARAAGEVAGPSHREYGTLGGNLCLDTRCVFYNQSEWWRQSNDYCLKERGDTCHVASGGKQCFAAFSGDVAPALLVFQAEVDLIGLKGPRRIPLAKLYQNDGMDQLTLKAGELLTAVHLPKVLAGCPSRYEKTRIRGSIDFPLAGAAVRLKMKGKKVEDFAIALTGVNPYPQIVKSTDEYIGNAFDDESLDKLRDSVRKQAKPMKTTTVAPWYRRRVVGAVARRLTEELAG